MNFIKKNISISLLFLVLFLKPVYGEEPAIDISDRNYFLKLRELFTLAERSIDISSEAIVFSDKPGDPVGILLGDLVMAQKRGARVRLFLNTFTPHGTQDSLFLHEDKLWSLRREGVEIHFVSPTYHLTDQLVLIDYKKVLEGGLRWSWQDLEKGLGSATLMESPALAEKKRIRLEFLPLWDVEQKREDQTQGSVAVPFYLLHEMRYFPEMVIHDDGDSLKIYLALLRLFYKTQNVRLTAIYEDLAGEIPADQYFEKNAVHFQVMKALERLDSGYELIQMEKKEADRAYIQMILPSQSEAVIKIPLFFFQEGYAKDLTPPALFAYFVIAYKTQISGESPVWLGSERNVEQDFPVSSEIFRAGVRELRERNLVEIFPFMLQEGIRKMNALEYRYLLNPVPTMSQRLDTWDRLREEFGTDDVKKAQQLAAMLGEPEDPKVIAVYLRLMKNFSENEVMSFTERVAMLPPQSTPAQMNYLQTLLEHETSNTQLVTTP